MLGILAIGHLAGLQVSGKGKLSAGSKESGPGGPRSYGASPPHCPNAAAFGARTSTSALAGAAISPGAIEYQGLPLL